MPKKIEYVAVGKGEVILFMHGWGQNKEMMIPLIEELKNKYKCVVLDLPGFGKSDFNNEKNLEEYVSNIRCFLEENNMLPKYVVGHSFGGKLCVEYYLKYKDISKMFIIASPILKPKRKLSYYYKIYKYKMLKKIKQKKKVEGGSEDYKHCPSYMKNFFVNVVNTHYDSRVKDILVPTVLLWGDKDNQVPLNRGEKLNKLIENSDLHIVKGSHFAYLENLQFTKLLLNKFFRR